MSSRQIFGIKMQAKLDALEKMRKDILESNPSRRPRWKL